MKGNVQVRLSILEKLIKVAPMHGSRLKKLELRNLD